MENIIASTGDIKSNYEIIGTTSFYFNSLVHKEPKKIVDIFDFIIDNLKKQAKEKGGDAVIFIKMDLENVVTALNVTLNIFAYATVVKIRT